MIVIAMIIINNINTYNHSYLILIKSTGQIVNLESAPKPVWVFNWTIYATKPVKPSKT